MEQELEHAGFEVDWTVAETRPALALAIAGDPWDIVLCRDQTEHLRCGEVLELMREMNLDTPCVVLADGSQGDANGLSKEGASSVNGASGDATCKDALAALRAGAADYIAPGEMARLAAVVAREVRAADKRRQRRQSEQQMLETTFRMRAVSRAFVDVHFRLDADGTILDHGEGEALGPQVSPDEMLGRRIQDVVPAASRESFEATIARANETRQPVALNYAWPPDGAQRDAPQRDGAPHEAERDEQASERRFEARLLPLADRQIMVVAREVTASEQTAEALRQKEVQLATVVSGTPIVLFALDRAGTFTLSEGRGLQALGLAPGQVVGQSVFDVYSEMPELLEEIRAALAGRETNLTVPVRGLLFETRLSPLRDGSGEVAGVIGVATDVTARKALEEELQHRLFHDPLTNLPNRALFMNRLGHALARSDRQTGWVALLLLDLDRFNIVNDSLGHDKGDQLLIEAARRLQASLRPGDTVARLGGDEFAILLDNIESASGAITVAERVARDLRAPFHLRQQEIFVTASIGITLNRSSQDSPDDLLRDADVALHRAKDAGRAQYQIFDPEMNVRALERLALESSLRQAIARGELRVHYQPKLRLSTRRIMGFEALVRWEHPQQGLIFPNDFMPLAEEAGIALDIGQWVLRQACRQARQWPTRHPLGLPLEVSVNLSSRQFEQPNLVSRVAGALHETGLDAAHLKLEITESVVLADTPETQHTLRELKRIGVLLSMDDFGTGPAALSYVRRFPVDNLKIDRSFVSSLGRDAETDIAAMEDSAIVSAIIGLAKTLGMVVTAEGIETEAQAARLQEMGCDLGQGYLFSAPLSSDEVNTLIEQIATPMDE